MAAKTIRKPGRPPKYAKAADEERSVKRFQVSMRPSIFDALEAFRKSQEFPTERSAIIEKLIELFLIEKGYCPKDKPHGT